MKNTCTYRIHLRCTCLWLVATVFFTACKKFVSLLPPPDVLVKDQVFTSDAKATAVVTAIYGSMINGSLGFSNSLTTIYLGYSADELQMFNPFETQQELAGNKLTPGNIGVKNLWSSLYKQVYFTNAVIEGLEASPALSAPVRASLVAECRFIRAFCYFYLVNLWGDVPLVQATAYEVNARAPRTAAADVWAAITADLLVAKEGLPAPVATAKTRPSRSAAAALLARVYLYRGQWEKAEADATSVIGAGGYPPLEAPSDVFRANSREAIWQLAPTLGFMKETAEMRPLGGMPQNYLALGLLAAFEPGDGRLAWVDSTVYEGSTWHYPAKYRNTADTPTEFYTVLRAAEQFLIRAEARLAQQNTGGAREDLNTVRQRAGLTPLPATVTEAELAAAIEKERQVEFFAEWGHRWLDLKRWNRAEAVLSPRKPGFKPAALLYPIPLDDILSNPFITQNPGY